ncbi:MAG TPA: hypothetical protein VIJ36_05770 [Thermoanaerobaculia bacterium]
MRDKIFPAFVLSFFAVFVGWFFYSYLRTRAEKIATLQSLSVADIRSVRLLLWSCAQEHPVELPPDSWAELVDRIHRAEPTESIGRREAWSILRAIEITTRNGHVLRLILTTRPSLGGSPRLVIGGETHYFEAGDLWRWLSDRPEFKLQESSRSKS